MQAQVSEQRDWERCVTFVWANFKQVDMKFNSTAMLTSTHYAWSDALTRRPLLPQRLAYFNQVLMSSWGLMTSDLTIRILCQSSTMRWQPWRKTHKDHKGPDGWMHYPFVTPLKREQTHSLKLRRMHTCGRRLKPRGPLTQPTLPVLNMPTREYEFTRPKIWNPQLDVCIHKCH